MKTANQTVTVAALPCRENGPGGSEPRQLVQEIPLTITADGQQVLTVCRTPGSDDLLALGVLFFHGLLERESEIVGRQRRSGESPAALPLDGDTMDFQLAGRPAAAPAADLLARLARRLPPEPAPRPRLTREKITRLLALPAAMAARQELRTATRAAHAVALFTPEGTLITCQEDVGRNNALDKAMGYCLRRRLDRKKATAVFSGRLNLEMALKINRAGFRTVVSVSAPTAAAVAVFARTGTACLGSVNRGRGILYHGIIV